LNVRTRIMHNSDMQGYSDTNTWPSTPSMAYRLRAIPLQKPNGGVVQMQTCINVPRSRPVARVMPALGPKYTNDPSLAPGRKARGGFMKHIDSGFYRISDKLAGKLGRAHKSGPNATDLPARGLERRVFHEGSWWWLKRTPYRYRTDAPKRGWVWALAHRHDMPNN
jgi:hypothetical protein